MGSARSICMDSKGQQVTSIWKNGAQACRHHHQHSFPDQQLKYIRDNLRRQIAKGGGERALQPAAVFRGSKLKDTLKGLWSRLRVASRDCLHGVLCVNRGRPRSTERTSLERIWSNRRPPKEFSRSLSTSRAYTSGSFKLIPISPRATLY